MSDERADKETADLARAILAGERRALARAITMVESTRADHRAQSIRLIDRLRRENRQGLRIGLSGTPGVGKSTFIEAFGMALVEQGKSVAVLAVDPSSARSGGSILGDKTRMERLSREGAAFIRPSPSASTLGGVGRRSREAALLCEAAGFDVIILETVGVGQSETLVADMSDLFILLLAPAGGDELQGVKRGIMEIADLILVNKADGDLKAQATRTCADYAGALRLMRRRDTDPEGYPLAQTVSAVTGEGLDQAWEHMVTLSEWRRANGVWQATRARQSVSWFEDEVQAGLRALLTGNVSLARLHDSLRDCVAEGEDSPETAAARLMEALRDAVRGDG